MYSVFGCEGAEQDDLETPLGIQVRPEGVTSAAALTDHCPGNLRSDKSSKKVAK